MNAEFRLFVPSKVNENSKQMYILVASREKTIMRGAVLQTRHEPEWVWRDVPVVKEEE